MTEALLLLKLVLNLSCRSDESLLRDEILHVLDELVDGALAEVKHSVLHHEVDKVEELLQLAELIALLLILSDVQVEPALANILERCLDDLGELIAPAD